MQIKALRMDANTLISKLMMDAEMIRNAIKRDYNDSELDAVDKLSESFIEATSSFRGKTKQVLLAILNIIVAFPLDNACTHVDCDSVTPEEIEKIKSELEHQLNKKLEEEPTKH